MYGKPFLGCPQVFIILNPPYMWDKDRRTQAASMDVDCWYYDWDGKQMVKVYYSIAIDKFRGTKPINELICYPTKYYNDESADAKIKTESDLLESLIIRGRSYEKTVKGPKGASQMYQYNGEALADRRNAIKQANDHPVLFSCL